MNTFTLKLSDICRALIPRRQPRILGMSPAQYHRRAEHLGIPHDDTACRWCGARSERQLPGIPCCRDAGRVVRKAA